MKSHVVGICGFSHGELGDGVKSDGNESAGVPSSTSPKEKLVL
jgi:hypothetical protein